MKTNEKPSDLINQAITNLPKGSNQLALKLWECMKEATAVELNILMDLERRNNAEYQKIRKQLCALEEYGPIEDLMIHKN